MIAIARNVRRRLVILVSLTAALVVGVFASGLATHALAEEYVDGERMLPGVTISGIDVSGMSVREATAAVERDVERRLDREITVSDEGGAWAVTPRDLGASADVEAAVREAADASSGASWPRVAAARWGGINLSVVVDAPLAADDDAVEAYVAEVAEEVDTGALPASVEWTADKAAVVDDDAGRSVDRSAAARQLAAAVSDEADTVDLPTRPDEANIQAAHVEPLLPAIQAAADATLERSLTLVAGDDEWEVTVGEVAAAPDLSDVVSRAYRLAEQGRSQEQIAEALIRVPVIADEGLLSDFVERLADEVAVDPVDARVDHSSGWVEIKPARDGRALDADGAADAIAAALAERGATVELPTESVDPHRTRADYRDVLLVRQNDRRLYHYRDGEVVADWPVAVGTNDQPTPTGTFTVGLKRYLPTWVNPSPDGWGEDMPDRIEPGPGNPLGVRALNWNRGSHDTLIRFHGTANVGSIGEAASNGCVRMRNSDVIDLYNRIPSGTTIVSVHG